ncbi:MAG: Crp/Fnr family transcriptional regulator [Pseudomonadota bacterium]
MKKYTSKTKDWNARSGLFEARWLDDVSAEGIDALVGALDTVHLEDKGRLNPELCRIGGIVTGAIRIRGSFAASGTPHIHIYHPGAWFGGYKAPSCMGASMTITAIGPTTIETISSDAFLAAAKQCPDLWRAYAQFEASKHCLTATIAGDLALRTSRQRIAAVLLRLTGYRGNCSDTVASTVAHVVQSDLARLANLSLSKTSLHLTRLVDEKLIRVEYGRIAIVDQDALEQVISS